MVCLLEMAVIFVYSKSKPIFSAFKCIKMYSIALFKNVLFFFKYPDSFTHKYSERHSARSLWSVGVRTWSRSLRRWSWRTQRGWRSRRRCAVRPDRAAVKWDASTDRYRTRLRPSLPTTARSRVCSTVSILFIYTLTLFSTIYLFNSLFANLITDLANLGK